MLNKRLHQQIEQPDQHLVHFEQNVESAEEDGPNEKDSNQMEAPFKLSRDEQIEQLRPPKEYGPQAVYKDGILGNFEPVVGERRNGPGILFDI